MINLLSISSFRHIVPTNAIVDDTVIASAINHAQVALIPNITSWDFYNTLVAHLAAGTLTDLESGFLIKVESALACYSAYHLIPLVGNQIHPTQISDAMPMGSKKALIDYYLNQTSAYLYGVYEYCDTNGIAYNKWKSTSFCSVVLGGTWS